MDSVLYIGTEKGVVTARSSDHRSWEIVERGLESWAVPELAVSPDGPNKVFAGTRGDGVWVSEDFGKSWKKPCYGKRGPGKVRCVTIDPHDSRRIYAGGEPIDLFVSEDEGKNWERLDAIWDIPFVATIPYPVATVEPHLRDLAVDPSDPDILYAALQVGYMVKSTDRGKSWKLLDDDIDCDVHTIVIDPSDPRHLFIATGGNGARNGDAPGRALYISEDAGDSWTPAAMNFSSEYSVPITLDPVDPKRVYSAVANGAPGGWRRRASGAEATMIRSDDGGANWKGIAAGIASEDFPEAIVADQEIAGRLYAGCRNGKMYTSDDGGDNFGAMDFGLEVSNLRCVVLAHA